MLEHPLKLKGTRVLSLAFTPVEGFTKEAFGWTINAEIGYVYDHRVKDRWGVRLAIKVGPDDEGKLPPYLIEAAMAGEYQWTGQLPPPNEMHMLATIVVQNGATMLYGMLREILALLTGRSVYGMFTLPSVSFGDYAADPMKIPKEETVLREKSQPRPRPRRKEKKRSRVKSRT